MVTRSNRGQKLSGRWNAIHLSEVECDGKLCHYYQSAESFK